MRAGFSGGQHYDDERPNFGVFGIPYWCGDGAVLYLGDSQAILGSKLHVRLEAKEIKRGRDRLLGSGLHERTLARLVSGLGGPGS